MLWKLLIFIVGTLILLYFSRRSLRDPRSHGFYRFFAWEAILLLFLANVEVWFQEPASWHQLISWPLLIICCVPLILGVSALRSRGRPDGAKRADPELMAFEKTTQLVTGGIYKYIRHPLYCSLLLLAWGIFFKDPSLLGFLLAFLAGIFLFATARADESECIQTFGEEYRTYMQHSRMFIPYIL